MSDQEGLFHSIHIVYWDNKNQRELWRGSREEFIKEVTDDTFDNSEGNYSPYPCISGYAIEKVIPKYGCEHKIVLFQQSDEDYCHYLRKEIKRLQTQNEDTLLQIELYERYAAKSYNKDTSN